MNTVNNNATQQVPGRIGGPGVRHPEKLLGGGGRASSPAGMRLGEWTHHPPGDSAPAAGQCFGAQRGPRGPIPARLGGNVARRWERRPGHRVPTGTPSRGQIHAQQAARQKASATRRAGQASGCDRATRQVNAPAKAGNTPTPAPPNQTLDRTPGHGPGNALLERRASRRMLPAPRPGAGQLGRCPSGICSKNPPSKRQVGLRHARPRLVTLPVPEPALAPPLRLLQCSEGAARPRSDAPRGNAAPPFDLRPSLTIPSSRRREAQ
jgi:hypothetical protein